MENFQFREKMGELLKNLRKERNESMQEIARLLGKKWQAYSAHEEGRSLPSTIELRKLREHFGFDSIDEMLDAASSKNVSA
jgi:transcriptional regulator with XRE-family HTH domain